MNNRYILAYLLIFIFYGCNFTRHEILEYVSVLKDYDFSNASIRKVQVDPSYYFPYNVYIRITLDTSYQKQLIKDLGLISKEEADPIEMKKVTNIDEFQLYFEMSSINKSRLPHLQKIEKKIEWWPKEFEGSIYATSYLDYESTKIPVLFTQKRNGRIVVSIQGSTIYFLIECWG